MFSDGYQDQFGGERGKRIMKKRFKDLLIKSYNLPMIEQKQILEKFLNNWKGNEDQIDDITVMGVKF